MPYFLLTFGDASRPPVGAIIEATSMFRARMTAVERRLAPGVPFGEGLKLSPEMQATIPPGRDRQDDVWCRGSGVHPSPCPGSQKAKAMTARLPAFSAGWPCESPCLAAAHARVDLHTSWFFTGMARSSAAARVTASATHQGPRGAASISGKSGHDRFSSPTDRLDLQRVRRRCDRESATCLPPRNQRERNLVINGLCRRIIHLRELTECIMRSPSPFTAEDPPPPRRPFFRAAHRCFCRRQFAGSKGRDGSAARAGALSRAPHQKPV